VARLKPLPRSERLIKYGGTQNRGNIKKRTNDTVKNVEVGLLDVDASIMYYFNEVIKPSVMEQGEEVKVPLMYANPERWATIRKQGYLRDSKRQLITPVIVFKRTSMSKRSEIAVDKLDANDPKLFYSFEKKYSSQNRYNRFSTDRGLLPQRELYNVAMPDYVTLNYECIIFTAYIEQMNKIIEKVNWADGSYWGEPGKLKFQSNIESFEDSTEMSEGERFIKTTFSLQLYGYLVPEAFNDKINTQKYITPKKIDVIDETDMSVSSLFNPDTKTQTLKAFTSTTKRNSGLAGTTDFIRGKTYAVGQEIQDLEFTNIYGGETMFVMRNSGSPTSSLDTKAVINMEYGNLFYQQSTLILSGSESSSKDGTTQLYDLQLGSNSSSMEILTGSLQVAANGMNLVSNNNQTNSNDPADFFITGSSTYSKTHLAVKGNSSNLSPGYNLKTTDKLNIVYQKTMSP
tara:strand:- start:1292 stop:2665 length:1374 start_codon:yes stop_codon:yes gene_type:complete